MDKPVVTCAYLEKEGGEREREGGGENCLVAITK
jgi:hypothetical protein